MMLLKEELPTPPPEACQPRLCCELPPLIAFFRIWLRYDGDDGFDGAPRDDGSPPAAPNIPLPLREIGFGVRVHDDEEDDGWRRGAPDP